MLAYLTPLEIEPGAIYPAGIERLQKVKYQGKIGYISIHNISQRNSPPYVNNTMKALEKFDFKIDLEAYKSKFKSAIERHNIYADLVNRGLYYADAPAFLTINGVDCQRRPQRVIVIAGQSTQFEDAALILMFFQNTDGTSKFTDNIHVRAGVNLINDYLEFKGIKPSPYCAY